jgi:hypothetical protein
MVDIGRFFVAGYCDFGFIAGAYASEIEAD